MFASTYLPLLLLLFETAVGQYPNPGPCTGACNVRDPALIRREFDGTYFLFSSHDKIGYASAESLAGPWTILGSVVPDGSVIDLPGWDDLWVSDRAA